MSVNWTKEQNQVIHHRGSNLLVSAAAGSGKTAVLVERIIQMVMDEKHPIDIDRLLVMTFTNAAAAEMRERIGAAIEKKLEEQPDNEHLQRQTALVHYAQITTIDSFCLNLIRTHFNSLDLDPSFRIGDEGELMLLRQDVMQELLEDYYASDNKDFERFVDTYATGKSDAGIEDYITKVYNFAQSNPYPAEWFAQCRNELAVCVSDKTSETTDAAKSDIISASVESAAIAIGNKTAVNSVPAKSIADPGLENPSKNENSEGSALKNRIHAMEQQPWMRFIMHDLRRQTAELAFQIESARMACEDDEFLNAYVPMLASDYRQLAACSRSETFPELYEVLANFKWETLARVRAKEVDPERKLYVTTIRDRAKKAVKTMQSLYAFASPEEMFSDMSAVDGPVGMLLELAEQFAKRYQAKKRERNLVDFNDLEHEALKVLIVQDEQGMPIVENGSYRYTDAADELSRMYDEVLVDEYQDSNLVQEALIQAVSGERFGRPNVFMVGDVKQSIYKFRLARPELFLEKYHQYAEIGGGTMIELHQNFRSRAEVLEGINDVFYRIMTENMGDICYTEEAALHPGAKFEPLPEVMTTVDLQQETGAEESSCELFYPELYMVDTGSDAMEGLDDEAADYTAKEIEAKLIAGKIREMTDPESGIQVWDKSLGENGGYRTAEYRDIVILLRSTADWTENILSVLMNENIPAYAESRMGYFNTLEVEIILSFLAVIDNPMQDIPLAAVLHSPIVGLGDEQLASLMAEYHNRTEKSQDRGIYAALHYYLHKDEINEEQSKHLENVFAQESALWEQLSLWDVAVDSGKANLDSVQKPTISVVEKTSAERSAAEKLSGEISIAKIPNTDAANTENDAAPLEEKDQELYRKLSNFESMLLRFRQESYYLPIHELIYRVYERTGYYHYVSAMPGGQTRQANLDMLVEKAAAYEKTSYKGLFHFIRYIQNLKKYDTDFGEASTLGENDNTVRLMSIHKSKGLEFPIIFLAGMGKRFNKQDVCSRILIDPELGIGTDYLNLEYRVKTSTLKKNVLRRKMELDNLGEELRVLYVAMTRAKEHLIMTATDRSLEKKMEMYAPGTVDLVNHQIPYTILSTASGYLDWILMASSAYQMHIRIEEVPIQNLMEEEVSRQLINEHTKSSLTGMDLTRTYHEEFREMLEQHLNYVYPHKTDIYLHTKMSVSELKKQGQMVDEAESVQPFASPVSHYAEIETHIDRDDTPPDNGYGATRGTAYHRAMELLPFHEIRTSEEIQKYLETMVSQKRYPKESLDMIDPAVIETFLSSPLGRRMAEAQRTGNLHKEQQFVMGVPANEMGDYDSEELIVVQGIIDAYFEEEDGLVLVDYKTDKTRSIRILLEHYRTQIDYYAKALEQMTGRKVKERIIYSLTLQKTIICRPEKMSI